MSKQDGAEAESRAKAKGSWSTGRPTRWRATSDAELRRREGVAKPGDTEPGVVEGLLSERWGLLDVMFDDHDGD